MENASRKRREITVDLPFLWKTFKLFHQTRCLALGSNDIFPNSVPFQRSFSNSTRRQCLFLLTVGPSSSRSALASSRGRGTQHRAREDSQDTVATARVSEGGAP